MAWLWQSLTGLQIAAFGGPAWEQETERAFGLPRAVPLKARYLPLLARLASLWPLRYQSAKSSARVYLPTGWRDNSYIFYCA